MKIFKSFALVLTVLVAAGTASAAGDNPVLGTWD